MVERGHKVNQRLHQVFAVVGIGNFFQRFQVVKEGVFVQLQGRAHKNFAVIGFAHALFVHQKLFIQFFARAKAGEFNLDIPVRNKAGELDEVFRQVQYLHGVAHIQHKDIAAVAHGPGLQHKAHGLGENSAQYPGVSP